MPVRRRFAASFVITVAACGSSTAPPKHEPQPTRWDVVKLEDGCRAEQWYSNEGCPPGYHCNPPPQTFLQVECPPDMVERGDKAVIEARDGGCVTVPPTMCPAGTPCPTEKPTPCPSGPMPTTPTPE